MNAAFVGLLIIIAISEGRKYGVCEVAIKLKQMGVSSTLMPVCKAD